MDGDLAPLREMVELKNRYGASLMVDETHDTGLYGTYRRGLAEELGISDQIEIQMGTLGKALGASGGYICGARELIDYLVNRARSFVFSTAPVPAAAAAATAGVRLVQSSAGEERRRRLWERVSDFTGLTTNRPGQPKPEPQTLEARAERSEESPLPGRGSAIIPLHIGDEGKALEAARTLRDQGILIPAIRYPTVARGSARLRVTMTAAHTRTEVEQVVERLQALQLEFGNSPTLDYPSTAD